MTSGQRIKAARTAQGMSQAELAARLEIPYQSIGQWERGERKPKLASLQRLAEALGVPMGTLLDEDAAAVYGAGYDAGAQAEAWEARVLEVLERDAPQDAAWERLRAAFSLLSEAGRQEAVKRVEELTEVPRYRQE